MTDFAVPIAFIVFNRPESTAVVFDAIRRIRPRQLLIVADGPRPERPEEPAKCTAVRAIAESVDWPCTVLKNYSEVNLGCKRRVSTGLNWVFEQVEEAIILEDDCLPDPAFFGFCREMLACYRHDERIMHIGGANFQFGERRGEGSYYFSRLTHIWGWASWRRAWRHYDVEMKQLPTFLAGREMGNSVPHPKMQKYWQTQFELVARGEIDTWDYQWTFAMWHQNGLSIIPNTNLVTNIGFGQDATHTRQSWSDFSNIPSHSIGPLIHPSFVLPQHDADLATFRMMLKVPYPKIIRERLLRFFGK